MDWRTNLANLKRIGQLKEAARHEPSIQQFLSNADVFLADARIVNAAQSRFLLAYEGIHAISLAILNHIGVRADEADGHRSLALGIAAQALELDAVQSGGIRIVMSMHQDRNQKTYRSPIPPVTMTNANAAVRMLELCLNKARVFVDGEDARPEAKPGNSR